MVNVFYCRDVSFVFGVNFKWGDFLVVFLGWNVYNEKFLNGNGFLSRLKFRVSYGFIGNENFSVGDDIVNNYFYLVLLSIISVIIEGGIIVGVFLLSIVNFLL